MARLLLHFLSDSALIIRFGNRIDPEVHRRLMGAMVAIEEARLPGIIEMVPAYGSLTIHYDPVQVLSMALPSPPFHLPLSPSHSSASRPLPFDILVSWLRELLASVKEPPREAEPGKTVEIPVLYGGAAGPDLELVAGHCGLSPEEVISIHSGEPYRVYMIGFMPGFPYLGGMSERIAIPRRTSPRPHVPAGTVAIGGLQTGIYPLDAPGGWHSIGRTPLPLFLPERTPPTLLEIGDRVHFRPISSKEFALLRGLP